MIKKLKLVLMGVLLACVATLAAGCTADTSNENKKYDVAIRVACWCTNEDGYIEGGYSMHEVEFAPNESEKTIDIDYTGAYIRYFVTEYKLIGHPTKGDEWIKPEFSGANVFQVHCISYIYDEQLGEYKADKGVPSRAIKERGKYRYQFYADSTSDIWNDRFVNLYVYIK